MDKSSKLTQNINLVDKRALNPLITIFSTLKKLVRRINILSRDREEINKRTQTELVGIKKKRSEVKKLLGELITRLDAG
jgi:ribosomal protein S2